MRRAIDYAHLIGRVIRMEHDTYDDGEHFGEGMQAFVVAVWDITTVNGRRGVVISGDDGLAFTVWEGQEDEWHFAIVRDEAVLAGLTRWSVVPQTFEAAQKIAQGKPIRRR